MMEDHKEGPHYRISDTKNVDLLRERQAATFDVEQLTQFMFGGPNNYFDVNTRRRLSRLAYSHPIHSTHLPLEYLDHEDYYSLNIRKSFLAIKEAQRLKITDINHLIWFAEAFAPRFMFMLHITFFMNALKKLATEEQRRKFLPLIESYRILGTYAQTELGHGSDVRGLETEAVFDRATDSFVLNTPTLTATKFWPGALGRSDNYALIMAQLYTPDRDHPCGVQMFLVQIRDLDTHEPMPGIEVGEIGRRFANEVGDNGYLRLTNVRVPRNQMLMELAHVDEQGNFDRKGDPRLLYSLMLIARVGLCSSFSIYLAQAVTIAVRYAAVRHQGQNPTGNETLILDYPLQQEKLVPCIATVYAFLFAFKKLNHLHTQMETGGGIRLDQLPELHALSSGLKAYTSSVCERLSKVCRMACGGHGFLVASGLVGISNMLDAACSYEGDNSVLLQQTARYLLKMIQQIDESSDRNPAKSSVAYLYGLTSSSSAPTMTTANLDDYCPLFENRSRLLIENIYKQMIDSSSPPYDVFLKNSIQLVHVAKAYIETFVVRAFYEGVCSAAQHPSISSILDKLFRVFAIHTLRNQSADFIRLKLLSADQVYELETRCLPELYGQLRPNLVTLVDSFDFHDNQLNSCLGRYDGQVYEALMENARLNPTNRYKVHPVWSSIKQENKSKL